MLDRRWGVGEGVTLLAIRMDHVAPGPAKGRDDVVIVWKGRRIAKLIFASGKVVEFDEPVDPGIAAEPGSAPVPGRAAQR